MLQRLPRFRVDDDMGCLHEVVLEVRGGGPSQFVEALLGEFSPLPPCGCIPWAPLVEADPAIGDCPLANAEAVDGAVALMERGSCSFVAKALRAQAANAVAVVVVQTFDVWPFTMRDKAGEAAGRLGVPVVMVAQPAGQFLRGLARDAHPCTAALRVHRRDDTCPVCQEEYAVGEAVLRLPCRHIFHETCVASWLGKQNTCPLCRFELPLGDPELQTRAEARARVETWRHWFA